MEELFHLPPHRSPLLLHLLEGPGPPAVAARDLLDLLPLLLLLHHVRVDAAAPALPLAQVLQRYGDRRATCMIVLPAPDAFSSRRRSSALAAARRTNSGVQEAGLGGMRRRVKGERGGFV